MNHIYRLTWNDAQQSYVPTPESARGRHKQGGRARRRLARAAVAATLLAAASGALAGPTGAQVSSGTASLLQNGATLTINQSSQNLALNWQSFNIASNETVNFVQPGASAVALNRVLGSDPSAIYGKLNANGQVFLINTNGILFGKGAEVNVGGLVASTLNLSDADFVAGKRSFSGHGNAGVTNQGRIGADGGYVALLGGQVSNQGTLQATLGTVALAAGQQATLDFAGDKLISVQVDRGALHALAENRQLVQADGGTVVLTAKAADQLVAAVVNNSGLIQARTLANRAGVITLLGDTQAGQVKLGGTLDASAPAGGNGGFIETSAATVTVADSAHVSTAAPAGRTGTWLIDPHDFTVAASGGDISGAALAGNLASTNAVLQSSAGHAAGAGNLNVNDAVSWSANTTLTLTATNHVNVNAAISATGAGAGLAINPNSANGGEAASGTGSFNLGAGAAINLPNVAPASSTALVIAGTPYTVINSLGQAGDSGAASLQGIGGNLSGHYALGSDIDASKTANWNGHAGFAPLGNSSSTFSGVMDGLGHTVSGLTINRPATDNVGLFGQVGSTGSVRNLGLSGGSISGRSQVGPLAGGNDGTLSNVNATTSVSGSSQLGGLVGISFGAIDNAYAAGSVVGGSTESGGLTGSNYGTIRNAYATGVVSGGSYAGGLTGSNAGAVSYAYATGSASGTSFVGGLVGLNSGSLATAYAIGSVSGSSSVGGLAGRNSGTLNATYWNSDAKAVGVGAGSAAGATGLTAANMRVASSFAGFSFGTGASGWVLVDADGTLNNAGGAAGGTTPMLAAEYATAITNAHQLQLMAMSPSAAYTLRGAIDAGGSGSGKDVWGAKGFVPVGNLSTPFNGSFDGMSQTVRGLTLNAPSSNYVGLFGYIQTGSVQNLGLIGGSVSGGKYAGALAGKSDGAINNVYASTAVNGNNNVGGLVGNNAGTISNAYATGNVSASALVGGLVGANGGAISKAYASGLVSGTAAGGLAGSNVGGTLAGSFWNSDVNAAGIGSGVSDGALGLTTAQLQTGANFAGATSANGNLNPGWDFQSTWLAYDGHTAPLLRSFLTALTVTANSATKTYDGQAYAGFGASYSSTPGTELLGTISYGGTAPGASNAGSYTIAPGGLYSSQQGYAINFVGGALTVKPAVLTVQGTVAANKVYDGTTAASLAGGSLSGVIAGDAVTLVQSGVFARKDAGSGIAVTATDSLGGSAAGNYTLSQPLGLLANITPKQLTVDGTTVAGKVYDGLRDAVLTGGTLAGLVAGDTVKLSQTGLFASKNAGTAIAVQASAGLSGSDAGNYSVLAPAGLSGDITPKQLAVHGTLSGNKVYDGSASATVSGGSVTGVVSGDSVTFSQSGSFADKNVEKNKLLTYTNKLSGADSANYSLPAAGGVTTANITARNLTVLGTSAASKVYDGTTGVTLDANLTGLVANDAVSLVQSGSFADKNVGLNKLVSYKNSLSGVDAANYTLSADSGTTNANISAKPLVVTGSTVLTKVYDASTKATLTNGVLVGVVGTDKIKLNQSGAFVTKNAGTGVAVTATSSLSGGDASNYTLIEPLGLTGTITPKLLSASAPSAAKKVYDGTTAVTLKTGKVSGVITGDTVTLVQNGAFGDKNAGSNKPVAYNNSLAGSDAGNYTLKLAGGVVKATITPLKLTVGPGTTAADKIYDGTTVATVSGGLLDGVLAHDVVSFSQAGKFASKRTGVQTVTYTNTLAGRDAKNYTLSEKGGKTTAEILAP